MKLCRKTFIQKEFQVICKPILYDKKGEVISKNYFEFEVEEVKFNIHTLPTKMVPLIINPVCSNYVKQYINTFSALPTEVMIAADQRMLDNTNILELNIPIELSYEDLSKETYTTKVDIAQYVSNGFYIPDEYKEVDVVIGFAGEIKRDIDFTLQDIEIKNYDEEKYSISIAQNNFTVSVFGPKDEVMNLSVRNLSPYIDLSNISEGNNTIFVEFNVHGNLMVTSVKVNVVAKENVQETEPPTEEPTTSPTDPTEQETTEPAQST